MLTLKTSKQTVTRLAFSADGRWLAAAGTGHKVHLWDLTAKRVRPSAPVTFKMGGAAFIGFRPDDKLFALSSTGQYATVDPAAGTADEGALPVHGWVGEVVAEPDFSALYGTAWRVQKWSHDGRSLRQRWVSEIPGDMLAGRGGAVLTPGGGLLAGVMENGIRTRLHGCDAATGAPAAGRPLSRSLVLDLSLLPDGRLAFVQTQEYQGPAPNALIAGPPDGPFEEVARPAPGTEFTALALHPSGRWAAVGQSDGVVRTFGTATWAEAGAHKWLVGPVRGLAFAPGGLTAAAGGERGQVVVWDVDF